MLKAQLLHQRSAAKHLQMAAWEKYWFSITGICLIQHWIHNHSLLISIGPQEACLFYIVRNKPARQFIGAACFLNKQEEKRCKDAHTAGGNATVTLPKTTLLSTKQKERGGSAVLCTPTWKFWKGYPLLVVLPSTLPCHDAVHLCLEWQKISGTNSVAFIFFRWF